MLFIAVAQPVSPPDITQIRLWDVFGWTLSLASLVIAALGVALILGGVFAFYNIRQKAESVARKTAERVAKKVAEETANLYVQENLQAILQEYVNMMQGSSDLEANQIAKAEADENNH